MAPIVVRPGKWLSLDEMPVDVADWPDRMARLQRRILGTVCSGDAVVHG